MPFSKAPPAAPHQAGNADVRQDMDPAHGEAAARAVTADPAAVREEQAKQQLELARAAFGKAQQHAQQQQLGAYSHWIEQALKVVRLPAQSHPDVIT